MVKSELIEKLSERFTHLNRKDVDAAVRLLLDHMAETLASGERIEIRRFGSFVRKQKNPRIGRNPKTGAKVDVPATFSVHFRAGAPMKELLNGKGSGQPNHSGDY